MAGAPNRNSFASNLSDAEIACFLSHIACWRIVAEGNDVYAAILEDEVLISAAARQLFADSDWTIPCPGSRGRISALRAISFRNRPRVFDRPIPSTAKTRYRRRQKGETDLRIWQKYP
ncbi:glycosyltransferase family 25 protein [Mesorhizobium waimense]|uniref:glycosyltransferase family 25 protein n=1 Tax=Mesorhizobium waimense TaxID=1300307 RepID=UPI001FE16E2E|nr:glycosyltransferase family 25 protein [Mesorhizobium waimense]